MNAIIEKTIAPDLIQVCYHRQDEGCLCRKPKPGMLLSAAQQLDLDLPRSFMVGDRASDMAAGEAAGCSTVFIDRGYGEKKPEKAWAYAGSLGEAVEQIVAHTRRAELAAI
jgi:D-glycero-D-manno-heptose 1,7-bisphosphate phosphatase